MDEVLRELRALGYPEAHWLADGMEGAVYRLESSGLPFATPTPLGRLPLADGRMLHLERSLPGHHLDDFYDPARGLTDERVVRALGDILEQLHTVPGDGLPFRVLDEGEPYTLVRIVR